MAASRRNDGSTPSIVSRPVPRRASSRRGDVRPAPTHLPRLPKDRRLAAEHRLKTGALKALVATASLELGIDIGHVDLVCQIGSPPRLAPVLQPGRPCG